MSRYKELYRDSLQVLKELRGELHSSAGTSVTRHLDEAIRELEAKLEDEELDHAKKVMMLLNILYLVGRVVGQLPSVVKAIEELQK